MPTWPCSQSSRCRGATCTSSCGNSTNKKEARASVPPADGAGVGVCLPRRDIFPSRLLVPLLLPAAHQRPLISPGQFQREIPRRQREEGAVSGAHEQGGLVSAELPRYLRHARQRLR